MWMGNEGLQVGVGGRRGRVMQWRVAPRVKLCLRQDQHPSYSILLNDLKTDHTQKDNESNRQKQKGRSTH